MNKIKDIWGNWLGNEYSYGKLRQAFRSVWLDFWQAAETFCWRMKNK